MNVAKNSQGNVGNKFDCLGFMDILWIVSAMRTKYT
jgi:hypothetical protein